MKRQPINDSVFVLTLANFLILLVMQKINADTKTVAISETYYQETKVNSTKSTQRFINHAEMHVNGRNSFKNFTSSVFRHLPLFASPSIIKRHQTVSIKDGKVSQREEEKESLEQTQSKMVMKEMQISNETVQYSVGYKLYNYKCTEGVTLRYGKEVSRTNWAAGEESVFIIHGWLQFKYEQTMVFKDAYITSHRPENVIIVYWESPPTQLNYVEAAKDTYLVGVAVAHMIIYLKTQNLLNYNQVKLVGFSLGAHVAGVAGFFINDKLQTKIKEITGLDPAGPMFDEHVHLQYRLDKTDAKFVQVIHCNMGRLMWPLFSVHYGSNLAIGHVDFYPNGGVEQPNCSPPFTSTCSHLRCCELYASTVRGHSFSGCECDDVKKFFVDTCHPHNTCTCNGPSMGDLCPSNATGKYCLNAEPNSLDRLKYLY